MGLLDRVLALARLAQPTAPGPLKDLPLPAKLLLATLPGGGAATSPLAQGAATRVLNPLLEKDRQLGRDFAGGLVQDVLTPLGLPLQERFAPNTDLTATMRAIAALPDR